MYETFRAWVSNLWHTFMGSMICDRAWQGKAVKSSKNLAWPTLCTAAVLRRCGVLVMFQASIAIRDGKVLNIAAEDLVVGDIITVKFGDRMPADIRVIECQGFKVTSFIHSFILSFIHSFVHSSLRMSCIVRLIVLTLNCKILKMITIFSQNEMKVTKIFTYEEMRNNNEDEWGDSECL